MITNLYDTTARLFDKRFIWTDAVGLGLYEWYIQERNGDWTSRKVIKATNHPQALRIAVAMNTKVSP